MGLVERRLDSTTRAQLAATRAPLQRASHAPGFIYTSPEVYAAEKERIWMTDWIAVARVEELAKPGDYMALRIVDEPLLLTRDAEGRIHGFANVCAHRGVEVATGSGNTKEFMCPYHGWLYGLDGHLLGAPYMKEAEGFDPKTCRLPAVHCDVWQGWVFVNFSATPEPLADFVADFNADFGFIRQQDLAIAAKLDIVLDCNWKLVVENAMDKYHIGTIHSATLGYGVDHTAVEFWLKRRGMYGTFFSFAPRFNNHRPLFDQTMDSLKDKPLDFAGASFMAPNFQQYYYCDNVECLTYWPLGVDKTRLYAYLLFPKACLNHPEFASRIKQYTDTETRVFEEDRALVQSLQRGVASRMFQPGRLCRMEEPIHNVINNYSERMFGA